jgi:hypothetical protein
MSSLCVTFHPRRPCQSPEPGFQHREDEDARFVNSSLADLIFLALENVNFDTLKTMPSCCGLCSRQIHTVPAAALLRICRALPKRGGQPMRFSVRRHSRIL